MYWARDYGPGTIIGSRMRQQQHRQILYYYGAYFLQKGHLEQTS